MFQNQFPQKAFENAKRFKLVQAFKCGSFEDICSAITLGFVCPLGIYVDQNFSRIDSDGVAGVPSGMNGGGHCILGMGLKKSSRYGWVIKIQNSWGGNFGRNGYAYIHKAHFQKMNPDAFAIQSIIDDPQDSTPIDEVPVVTN
jgi:C1A family cysteine protease